MAESSDTIPCSMQELQGGLQSASVCCSSPDVCVLSSVCFLEAAVSASLVRSYGSS